MRDGLEDISDFFPSSSTGEQGPVLHVMLLVQKAFCHSPLEEVPKIVANLSHLLYLFPHRELCQPFTQSQVFANYLLPHSCTLPESEGADHEG